jgi:hypothetical protein
MPLMHFWLLLQNACLLVGIQRPWPRWTQLWDWLQTGLGGL